MYTEGKHAHTNAIQVYEFIKQTPDFIITGYNMMIEKSAST